MRSRQHCFGDQLLYNARQEFNGREAMAERGVGPAGTGSGQPLMRSINRLHVMDALRVHGPVSRVEIGARTGLAPATVSEITGVLLAENLLRESHVVVGGRGRPRIMLEINADGGRV